jgi:hypothetical protein
LRRRTKNEPIADEPDKCITISGVLQKNDQQHRRGHFQSNILCQETMKCKTKEKKRHTKQPRKNNNLEKIKRNYEGIEGGEQNRIAQACQKLFGVCILHAQLAQRLQRQLSRPLLVSRLGLKTKQNNETTRTKITFVRTF